MLALMKQTRSADSLALTLWRNVDVNYTEIVRCNLRLRLNLPHRAPNVTKDPQRCYEYIIGVEMVCDTFVAGNCAFGV